MTKLTLDDIQRLEASLTPEQEAHATTLFIAAGWGPGDLIPLHICWQIFSEAKTSTQAKDPPPE